MKILITLLSLLILEAIIIFMLIEKNRLNNMNIDEPGYSPKIPLNIVINIYPENIALKSISVDTT